MGYKSVLYGTEAKVASKPKKKGKRKKRKKSSKAVPVKVAVAPDAPIAAVVAKCKECMFEGEDPFTCEVRDCQFYARRTGFERGKKDSTPETIRRGTHLKIRAYCSWCMSRMRKEIAECHLTDCVLHKWRMGPDEAQD